MLGSATGRYNLLMNSVTSTSSSGVLQSGPIQPCSVVTIDLSAIDGNMKALRRMVGPDCGICPVVKADAYGLGAQRIARQLVASGADMLAVFSPDEAVTLFDAGLATPVLVLMPVWQVSRSDDLYRALTRGLVHLTVHSERHLEQLAALAERYASVLPLHLELDTGMSRGGCAEAEAARVLEQINRHRLLRLAGVFSHFARARDSRALTEQQQQRFDAFVRLHAALIPGDCALHMANTAATLRGPEFHQRMVRVGLAWAGYGSELLPDDELGFEAQVLQPAVQWTSRIVHTKTIERGTTVGYGCRWTALRPTRLGLIPVGYSDGYSPMLKRTDTDVQPARVRIMNLDDDTVPSEFVPVIGGISMDQITVDLTDMPDDVAEGSPVELIGTDRNAPNYLASMASAMGVIPHVVLASLHPSVPRQYRAARPTNPVVETLAGAQRPMAEVAAVVRGE